jgi:uncharacterized phage protein gp47/JayE
MASNTTFTGNYSLGTNGVIIPDTADVLATVQNEYRAALGADLSLEESTPQGRLIDAETQARMSTLRFNAQMANILINISLSSGSALDAWGANFDIPRKGATASRVPVLVTGIPDTVIPANSQAATAEGVIWLAESEIVIGDNGEASGTFICSTTGPVVLAVGTLTTIVAGSTTGVNGWETITNTTVATPGVNRESDASYKARILAAIFNGTALLGNYASACYKVEGVNDVFAYENPYDTALQLDDVIIPRHSVFVCVDGGNSADVAQALYTVKSAGCGWTGNTTVTVIDPAYNTVNTVMYEIPTDVEVVLKIDLTNLNNSSEDLSDLVKNTLINYAQGEYAAQNFEKLGIRALISPFTIASVLNSQINGININGVQVGLKTPVAHAVASIFKQSITSGIRWASVDTSVFGTKAGANGTYSFIFDGTNWTLNNTTVTLSEYGITVTGDPITNDVVSIIYADGELAQSPINLFASEKPLILSENITVNING